MRFKKKMSGGARQGRGEGVEKGARTPSGMGCKHDTLPDVRMCLHTYVRTATAP